MGWKSKLRQISIIYVIQLIISTVIIFWVWKANLSLSDWLAWLGFETAWGCPLMFEWWRRLDDDYIRKQDEMNEGHQNLKNKYMNTIEV
jgi:hypothetical protein